MKTEINLLYLFIALQAITLILSIINHFKIKKMGLTNQEILAKLDEADQQTNEIAADLQDLINSQGVSQEVADRLSAHVDKLKTIAATHTPAGSGGGGEEPPTT